MLMYPNDLIKSIQKEDIIQRFHCMLLEKQKMVLQE